MKILKIFFIFLGIIFFLFNMLLGYWGIATIFLTFYFYGFIWLSGRYLIVRKTYDSDNYKNYILLYSSIIIALVIAEIGMKVFKIDDPNNADILTCDYPYGTEADNLFYKYYLKRPDMTVRTSLYNQTVIDDQDEFKFKHKYNSFGLRGDTPSIAKDLVNIVALGDSYTEGMGAPEDSSWPFQLGVALNQCKVFDKHVQCINAGMHGSDPFFEYHILTKLMLRYKPEIVLISINQSDILDVIKSGGSERFAKDKDLLMRPHPWWYFLYQSSAIFRYIMHFHRNSLMQTDSQYESEKNVALQKIQHCITTDFVKIARQHNFKFYVILNPIQTELENSKFELQSVADSMAKDKDFVTINLFNEFKERKDSLKYNYSSLFWLADCHNNSKGYNIWASIVADKIVADILEHPVK